MDTLPSLARRCWKLLETIHRPVYFAPEPAQEFAALGLDGFAAYFASRAAAFGAVPAQVVTATFYNFSPDLVASVIPAAWETATPQQVLEARHRGIAATLHRQLGPEGAREAAGLVRELTAGFDCAGRPLFAAHAALPWPDEPVLALWHGATLVREHRGDGHVAALLSAGTSPIDACITGGIDSGTLKFSRKTRGWTDQEWQQAVARLIEEGLLASDTELTEAGKRLRAELERRTDESALDGWASFGTASAERLEALLAPLAERVQAASGPAG